MVTGKLQLQTSQTGPLYLATPQLRHSGPSELSDASSQVDVSPGVQTQDQVQMVTRVPKQVANPNLDFDSITQIQSFNQAADTKKLLQLHLSQLKKSMSNPRIMEVVNLAIQESGADNYRVKHEGHMRSFKALQLVSSDCFSQLPPDVQQRLEKKLLPYLAYLAKESQNAQTAATTFDIVANTFDEQTNTHQLKTASEAAKKLQAGLPQLTQVTAQMRQQQAALNRNLQTQAVLLSNQMARFAQQAGITIPPEILRVYQMPNSPEKTAQLPQTMAALQKWLKSQKATASGEKLAILTGFEKFSIQMDLINQIQNCVARGEAIPASQIEQFQRLQRFVTTSTAIIERYQQATTESQKQSVLAELFDLEKTLGRSDMATSNVTNPGSSLRPSTPVPSDSGRTGTDVPSVTPVGSGVQSTTADAAFSQAPVWGPFQAYNQTVARAEQMGISLVPTAQKPPRLELPPAIADFDRRIQTVIRDSSRAFKETYQQGGEAALKRALQREKEQVLEPLLKHMRELEQSFDIANQKINEGLQKLNKPIAKTSALPPALEKLRKSLGQTNPQQFEQQYRKLKAELMSALAEYKGETRKLALAQMMNSMIAEQISKRYLENHSEEQQYQKEKLHLLSQQTAEQIEHALTASLETTDTTDLSQVSSALSALLAQSVQISPPLITHTDAERLQRLLAEQD